MRKRFRLWGFEKKKLHRPFVFRTKQPVERYFVIWQAIKFLLLFELYYCAKKTRGESAKKHHQA